MKSVIKLAVSISVCRSRRTDVDWHAWWHSTDELQRRLCTKCFGRNAKSSRVSPCVSL